MNVGGTHFRTIWVSEEDPAVIQIIDQRPLPHLFVIEDLTSVDEMATAIGDMHVRGAGLIGAAAGYGMYLAALRAPRDSAAAFDDAMRAAAEQLMATRPTAVNLEWAVKRQLEALRTADGEVEIKIEAAFHTAQTIADEDADFCRRIGQHGLRLIAEISRRKNGDPVNVLTHCNAGWLAFVDYGTATAPIYAAHDQKIPVHVWVDETRPRNQGARLTAWELGEHGVPHTIVADNVGGHLMQHGLVDLVITGTDRTTYTGDVANKIGTYLKALAARDNDIPFYVALPSSTFDWEMRDGLAEIPIEQRDGTEVRTITGLHQGEMTTVRLTPEKSPAANYAFDVTPARLVTGLITERGICDASEEGVLGLYPEKRRTA
jgi:methylthioribose-1-phosphate isomerase